MKKILPAIIALLLISSNLVASGDSDRCEAQGGSWEWNGNVNQWQCNEATPATTEEVAPAAEEEAPWPFACKYENIKNFGDKRYLKVASNDANPDILADSRTLLIDKKNKKIKVWVISVASEYGREIKIKDHPSEDYSDYGFNRIFLTINYQNKTYGSSVYSDHTCRGDSIVSEENIPLWTMIAPGSVGEGILDVITVKYNLKY